MAKVDRGKAIAIGRAGIEDAKEILALQYLAYQQEAALYQDYTIPPLTQSLDELREEFISSVVLKAVENGVIIGSVRAVAHDGVCHIGRLIVHPSRQRRGIGTQLMLAIERSFPQAACYELFTGSRSTGNIALYTRMGYAITAERDMNERVKLVVMRKECHTRLHEKSPTTCREDVPHVE